jgi:hypothetical protein
MASCGSAAQRRLWPPLALQPSAGYGLLWLCSPAQAMASCGSAAQRRLWPPLALQPRAAMHWPELRLQTRVSGLRLKLTNAMWVLTQVALTGFVYQAGRNSRVHCIWTYVWQRWKPSLSICCTMLQHWINAESFPVTVVCKHFASYQGYPNYRWDLIRDYKG